MKITNKIEIYLTDAPFWNGCIFGISYFNGMGAFSIQFLFWSIVFWKGDTTVDDVLTGY